jgi:hypothetical protein
MNHVFLTLERLTAPTDCITTFDSDGILGLSGMREKCGRMVTDSKGCAGTKKKVLMDVH